ncbi:hypothetical protein GCM10009621_08420 [Corynebacterium felinum]
MITLMEDVVSSWLNIAASRQSFMPVTKLVLMSFIGRGLLLVQASGGIFRFGISEIKPNGHCGVNSQFRLWA